MCVCFCVFVILCVCGCTEKCLGFVSWHTHVQPGTKTDCYQDQLLPHRVFRAMILHLYFEPPRLLLASCFSRDGPTSNHGPQSCDLGVADDRYNLTTVVAARAYGAWSRVASVNPRRHWELNGAPATPLRLRDSFPVPLFVFSVSEQRPPNIYYRLLCRRCCFVSQQLSSDLV